MGAQSTHGAAPALILVNGKFATLDRLRGAADAATRARCAKFFWPVLAFALGCVCAAFAYLAMGFAALAVPLAILCVHAWLPEPQTP